MSTGGLGKPDSHSDHHPVSFWGRSTVEEEDRELKEGQVNMTQRERDERRNIHSRTVRRTRWAT